MKKLLLAFVAIAIASSYAAGQTAKRRAVKTGTPNGIFSPAIITGDLVYTSGQIGIDPKTVSLPKGLKRSSSRFFKNLDDGVGGFRQQYRSCREGDSVSGGHERLQQDE